MFTAPEDLLPGLGLWRFAHPGLAQSLKERNQYIRDGGGKALV